MKRTTVESSNLASVGYDEGSETLEIEFQNGGIYEYYDVEKSTFDALMTAESHGRYFIANIKGEYDYNQVH